MAKCKKFGEGTLVDAGTTGEAVGMAKAARKKPLPSENKKEDKPAFTKYVKEPLRKVNDAASNYLESKGLTNPVDVIDEELGGETVSEARARRAGMPTSKGSSANFKSGGQARSSASKRADGIAIRGRTRA